MVEKKAVQPTQLALSLTLPDLAELKNYIPGQNQVCYQQVLSAAKGAGEFCIYLWGPTGSGKTHLLQGACERAVSNGLSAFYLSLSKRGRFSTKDLAGLEQLDMVCLDDIEAVAGDKSWEEELFHLYNKMKTNGKHMLVSALASPQLIKIALPDLRTRLGWGVIYHLHLLSDEEKLQAIKVRAKQRGMELPEEVGKYILSRAGRSMSDLHLLLEQLDNASLAYQRKLTIPFVKQILKW